MLHKRERAGRSKSTYVMGGPDLNILSNRVQAAAAYKASKPSMGSKGSEEGVVKCTKRKNRTGGKTSGGM